MKLSSQLQLKGKYPRTILLLVFTISLTIFLFSSDGHRYSPDEYWAHEQTIRMVTLEPHPLYVDGESTKLFEQPEGYALWTTGSPCYNFVICSGASVANSILQAPFMFLNNYFNIITEDTVEFTMDDFGHQHYVFWRNSQNSDFTFLELSYGPIFAALSVTVFFLSSNALNYKLKTSLILTLLFGLSTPIWAYSQTSLTNIPTLFFILFSFYFFTKYHKTQSSKFLIGCGLSLGFSYLIRPDTALIIAPIMIYFLITLVKHKQKIKKLFFFFTTITPFYFISIFIEYLRFGSTVGLSTTSGEISSFSKFTVDNVIFGSTGLLFSPGVGLFIFAPILLTIFFTLPDFYKKNKGYTFIFITFIILPVFYFGHMEFWHGLVGWSARYLLLFIPFFLLPLGASLELRKNIFLRINLITLGIMGFFFNLVYIIQDVSWFVWGSPARTGLFSLGDVQTSLYIHDAVIWTFEYSQLTHSIITAFSNLQLDLFFVKLFGAPIFIILLSVSLLVQILILKKLYLKNENYLK
ncbi:glycosyltransferase family 39 protein [Nitrosopumilus sp.]|nr:glycosyltransferase family 39 protein [Nitrosopumilus sp.]